MQKNKLWMYMLSISFAIISLFVGLFFISFDVNTAYADPQVVDDYSLQSVEAVYDGSYHYLQVTAGNDVIVEYLNSMNEYQSQKIGYKNVGEYEVIVRFSSEDKTPAYAHANIVITPQTLVVHANATKVYGENDAIDFTYSGVVGSEVPKFAGELSHLGGENVGNHDVTINTLTIEDNGKFIASNYALSIDVNSSLIITKRPLYVLPTSGQGKEYNSADRNIAYEVLNVLPSDSLLIGGYLSREEGERVGEYLIGLGSLHLKDTSSQNYILNMHANSVYYSIYPATLEISINDKHVLYGNVDTDFSYSFMNNTQIKFDVGDDLNIEYYCVDNFGNPVDEKTAKSEDGYVISATANNPNYVVTIHNGRYYVSYDVYDVTFIVFDDEFESIYEHFSKIGALPTEINLDFAGYSFEGWKTPEGETLKDISNYLVTKDTTFRAIYSAIRYTINYALNGGTFAVSENEYYFVTSNFDLPRPARYGYAFGGWYENEFYTGTQVEHINGQDMKNYILFAKWEANQYDVSLPENTQSEGYRIWKQDGKPSYDESYKIYIALDASHDKSYSSLKVYANWQRGGITKLVVNVVTNPQLVNLSNPDNPSTTYAECVIGKVIASDFAIEVEGITLNHYNIDFVASGLVIKRESVEHGQSLQVIPLIPDKEHYTQTSPYWSETDFENITEDKTIMAMYTPDTYIVTFVGEDGNEYKQSVVYGQKVSTEKLNVYKLGALEYFAFDSSLDNIEQDTTIHYSIESNVYIIYFVLLSLILLAVVVYVVISALHYSSHRKLRRTIK